MTQVSETNNKAKASGQTRSGTSGGGETGGGGGSGPQPIPERPKKIARKPRVSSSDKEPRRSSRA